MLRRLFPIALSLAVAGAALAQSITVNGPVGKGTPGATSIQGQDGMIPVTVSCPDGTCTSPIYVTDGGTVINVTLDGGSVFVNNDGGHPVPISCPDGTTSCFGGGGGGGGNVVVTNDAGNPVPVAFQNDAGNPIFINGSISATNPSVSATGSPVPSSATYSGMVVGGNLVGLAGTANGLKVDGSAVTQPVSASALPLPTGAATLTAQNTGNTSLASILTTLGSPMQQTGGSVTVTQATATNLKAQVVGPGTAGSQSGGVLTVQGDPSGTPIPITGSISATNPSVGTAGSAIPTSDTLVGFKDGSGNLQPLFGDTTNGLKVQVTTGGGSNASVGATGSSVPASATYLGVNVGGTLTGLATGQATMANSVPVVIASNQSTLTVSLSGTSSVNLAQVNGSTVATSGTGEQKVAVEGLGTAGSASGGVLTVQGSASGTAVPVSGTVSVSGTAAVNLAQVAGASTSTGHGTASGAIRVELPTDGTGVVNAAQSGTWNINNISGTVSLPTGAATQTTLASILSALGSPFQAGGSIGNTSFAATQATASLLNATVVGTTSAGAGASSGLITIQGNASGTAVPISAAALPLPSGASTAAGLTTINTTLGSPFQAGGSIGNTAFGISGTLPAFAATPTFQGPGTAGTPSGGVLSVQGVAGGTAVPISGSVTVSGTATVTQGAAAALSGYWPVGLSDGTNLLGVSAHPVRTDPTGTTTQPVALPTSATASTTGTCTSLTTSTQILASNASRHGAILTALSSNANRARYAFAASATAAQMPLEAGSSLPLDSTYTGPVSFITDSGGAAITICALEY